QFVDIGYRSAADRDDDVAAEHAAGTGGAVGGSRLDPHAGLASELVETDDPARQRPILSSDPDIASPHPALATPPRRYELAGCRRDRKADPLRHADDRRVDADDLARAGDERSAGIARVERRVGLDHAVDEPPRAGP